MYPPIDFEKLFEQSPNCYVLLSADLKIVTANAAYLRETASSLEDLVGRVLYEAFPHDPDNPNNASQQQLRTSLRRVVETGEPDTLAFIPYRVPRLTPAGRIDEDRYWSAIHTPILGKDSGRVEFILQHTVDVTELHDLKIQARQQESFTNNPVSDHQPVTLRKEAGVLDRARHLQAANLLLDAERLHLRSLFQQAPGFVAFLRGQTHIFELANEAYYQVVGFRELVGKPVREALPELTDQGFFELLDQVFESGLPHVGRSVRILLQQTPERPLTEAFIDFVYQPIKSPDGQVSGIFVQGSDVTEQKHAQDALQRSQATLEQTIAERTEALAASEQERARALYLSQHDSLTGLPNRAMFHSELSRILAGAEASGSEVSVLFIDIDQFKEINDSLGHHVGDMLLQGIARRLKDTVAGEADIVARLGGDEFGVISVDPANPDDLAATLVQSLTRPFLFADHRLVTGASIGITTYPADGTTPSQLLVNADMAMYQAKHRGRSTFVRYTENLDTEAKRRHAIRNALRDALSNDQLELHYQPLYALDRGTLVSAEALIRPHATGIPLLTAAEMITVAEDSGQIHQLGEWILRRVCAQIRAWLNAGLTPPRIAVNISSQQLREPEFVGLIDGLLREHGLEARSLELEITERTLMENNRVNIATLRALRERGIHIAVDDFGTGFSSLGYLKQFPIDSLKIDQIFIKGLPGDRHDAAITSAIVDMAHGLGLSVIAEGIEQEDQLEFVRRIGCDVGQGYMLSDALTASRLTEMLVDACQT